MRTEQAYLCKTLLPAVVMACLLPLMTITWWHTAVSFIVTYALVYLIGCNTYHRYWAHRQFAMRKWVEKTTVILGLFAFAGDPLNYARTHRQHHAFADTDKDPHSPTRGRWHAFVGWMFKDRPKAGPAIIRDMLTPEYAYLQTVAKDQVAIIWTMWFNLMLVPAGFLLGVLLAQIVAFVLEMLVNAVGHHTDGSGAIDRKTIAWLALASYHAQHHKNPGTPHEGDPGKIVIKLLESKQ